MISVPKKPLGHKCYGSIPHLPGSRMGPGDHHCHHGQEKICTEKARDRHDRILVQEKLDGSCVGVAMKDGKLNPLGRAGWPAASSPHEQHKLFAQWVWENEERFRTVLREGERIVGEWLAQAHGTRYDLNPLLNEPVTFFDPFIAFDIMEGQTRFNHDQFLARIDNLFTTPQVISEGPTPILTAMEMLGTHGYHRAIDPVEGVIYRVERSGKVDFLAKYVRPDKVDGSYLPEVSGKEAVWNWRPEAA